MQQAALSLPIPSRLMERMPATAETSFGLLSHDSVAGGGQLLAKDQAP